MNDAAVPEFTQPHDPAVGVDHNPFVLMVVCLAGDECCSRRATEIDLARAGYVRGEAKDSPSGSEMQGGGCLRIVSPDSGEQWIVGDVGLALKIVRGVLERGDRVEASIDEGAAR